MKRIPWIASLIVLTLGCGNMHEEPVSFNQHIRPILNEKCMRCHGGVKASGGFNLLFEATALGATESGQPAIVPGHAQGSEMVRRLTADDPDIRMPLEGDPLTEQEIDLISRWIDQGAKWEKHWAYIPPDPAIKVPESAHPDWPTNGIDAFVSRAMAAQGLDPNPEADRVDLMRRLYFDLTGLPPSPKQADAFLTDKSPDAYERLVDRLLASPHFGERWAAMWLDLARYADTKGYEKDSNRSIWKYRDWVIQAFNADMPFDQFTIEQLAGDLLDNPTEDQLIATAFHRNSIANDEGGTDDETFRIASVIERVGTTYEAWQSTTMACVQCHSHPYDPFRQEAFYASMAYFNNAQDRDIYNEQPKLYTYAPTEAEEVRAIIDYIEHELKPAHRPTTLPASLYEQRTHLLNSLGHRVVEAEEFTKSSPLIELIWPDLDMVWQVQDSSWIYFRDVDLSNVARIGFRAATALSFAGTISIHLDHPDGPQIGQARITKTGSWDGWAWSKPTEDHLFKEFIVPIEPTAGKRDVYFKFGMGDTFIQHLFYLDKIRYYERRPAMAQYPTTLRRKLDVLAAIPAQTTPIIQELPPDRSRTTRLFERGNWLTPGDTIQPAIPQVFADETDRAPDDRLAFAQWLASPDNPLTARVIVNRIWEQLFGRGLVPSMEEFGTQGDKPSHPNLLDWLAVRLMNEHQWHLKPLIREIVGSATYRQDSRIEADKLEADPDNRWLARGPRRRLSAEQIRDQILALSGLLDTTIGGPSVMLPELGIGPRNTPSWALSAEEGRYRRTLYTFWKRTDPFPDMITFDSADRSVCSSQRIQTNTPLQALNLLNDEVYFEAAAALARRVYQQHETPRQQIELAYKQLLFQAPAEAKLSLLEQLYDEALEHYRTHPEACREVVGESAYAPDEKSRLAALSLVANALFNLDALIVKS